MPANRTHDRRKHKDFNPYPYPPAKRRHGPVVDHSSCPSTCSIRTRQFLEDMSDMVVLRGKYKLYNKLGSGTFGVTYLADNMSRELSTLSAVKILPLGSHQSSEETLLIHQEVNMMKMVSGHVNIVNFQEIMVDKYYAYLFMEYYRGPSLRKLIDRGKYDLAFVKFVIFQFMDGVEYIHSRNVAHCDLKPQNIILADRDVLKIIDFGLATDQPQRLGNVGTDEYMAPETFKPVPWDCKVADIWSLGIILLFMLARKRPWQQANMKDEDYQYYYQYYIEYPYILRCLVPELSKDTARKLQSILNPNPSRRPSLRSIRRIVQSLT